MRRTGKQLFGKMAIPKAERATAAYPRPEERESEGAAEFDDHVQVRQPSSCTLGPDGGLPDGVAFFGSKSFTHVNATDFVFAPSLRATYITTAVLRRSGWNPVDNSGETGGHSEVFSPAEAKVLTALEQNTTLRDWIEGEEEHHSLWHAGECVQIDQVIVLQPRHERCDKRSYPCHCGTGKSNTSNHRPRAL